jgi:MFS family permease
MARIARSWQPVIVLSCLIGNTVTGVPIIIATFGVFLVPVTRALGWPRAAFSVVLLISALASCIIYPVAGRLADRYGVRRVAMTGNICFGLAVAALSLTTPSHIVVYGLYALTGGAATFYSVVVLSKSIPLWFKRSHGLLFGLTNACGINLGAAFSPTIAVWLINRFGWHAAYIGLGAIVIGVGLPAAFLQRAPASTEPVVPPGETKKMLVAEIAEAHRQSAYWRLLIAIALGGGSFNALTTHIVPLLTDRSIGIGVATTAFAVQALVSAGWQVALGLLLDRTGSPKIAGLMMAVSILGFVLLGFGGSAFSSIYGRIMGISVLLAGVAPTFMDIAFDRTGNYRLALIGFSLAVAISAFLVFTLPRYSSQRAVNSSAEEQRRNRGKLRAAEASQ